MRTSHGSIVALGYLPVKVARKPLRTVPDWTSGDAAHGLPSVWSVAIAMAPITAVVVVLVIVAMIVVMVVMAAMGVTLVAFPHGSYRGLAFALAPHLHD